MFVFGSNTFNRLQRRPTGAVEEVVEQAQRERFWIGVFRFHHGSRPAAAPDLGIACSADLCQFKRMEVTVTKPIEEFIEQQLAKGYADANEVTRQAFLRWMDEEEFEADPPRLREKLDAARQGKFRPYHPQAYDALVASADETAR
jgi:Arc/MetJ-type ribon-helix-helix transcriptional regulator